MHCTKRPISPEFVKGQVTRDKKRKTAESSPLTMHSKACSTAPYAARSSRLCHCAAAAGDSVTAVYTPTAACGNGPRGPCVRQFYAGGKISACCLVD